MEWNAFHSAVTILVAAVASYPVMKGKKQTVEATPADVMEYAINQLMDSHYQKMHKLAPDKAMAYLCDQQAVNRTMGIVLTNTLTYAKKNGSSMAREEIYHNFLICGQTLSLLSGKIMTDSTKSTKLIKERKTEYVESLIHMLTSKVSAFRQVHFGRMYAISVKVVETLVSGILRRLKALSKSWKGKK